MTTAAAARILVISDTHLGADDLDKLPAEVWELASTATAILHAGDVTDRAVLDALAARTPTHAVLGNNDRDLVGTLPEAQELVLGGVRIAMVHDAGPTKGRASRMARRFPAAGVVVFGHSHQPVVEESDDGRLLVNPGSPTHRRRQPVHTVAWLEVEDGSVRRAEIIEVGPLAGSRLSRG